MTDSKLTLERRGHVLLMGFNRPEKRNAFDVDTYLALASAYGELDRDAELRCGVLFGHGEHFTAGLDLTQWAPVLAQGKLAELAEGAIEPFGLDPCRRCRKPIVVAAQGVSFTVAVELMLAADIRVAARTARFAQLEVLRGFFPCGGATVRLMQEIGWGNAQRYLLTGDEFDGAEAYRMGFVQSLVEAGEQLTVAIAIAEKIAAAAPLGVQAVLASSRLARSAGSPAALAALMPALPALLGTEDMQEAIRAFGERRQAQFQGR
ncbi:MAG: enoyl-CoA hydratase [Lysobacterales bacterium CG02_land_8_20_14_3_00_62_12]|nr:MAG: enoyl-CoA hydratase [Xanthomonadales bacterium CG02_land_8_20_14_3_00_62_12]